MKGLWLPRPMATLSQPQKWSNSLTQAPVRTQYFVRRPLSTQVVVQRRPKSGFSPARKAFTRSSTPEQPLCRAGTLPGSESATVAKSAREPGTPSSKPRATVGARTQLRARCSVRYSKSARDTLTSQKVAAALWMAFSLNFAASSFPGGLRRSVAPGGGSSGSRRPSPMVTAAPLTSSSLSSVRRTTLSWLATATSMQVRPSRSTCEGSTSFSRRNSQTPTWEACTARCRGVIFISSSAAKLASK
mmetsp:Transcript_33939/g.107839  ORF Transcript_33939/g.107839 Transcript_33939/m.107839 type:complete len:245 (-) Transcript_33939:558-1292(-)